ncbi:uncharacterized protein LTR77_000177 [Saxophila tyrrhenica]|uniref:Uncharacterized protein n=1 Tax=Saxophila tyrrhenica TaxID=1690608 RepID=A0AAV9PMV0_9PEZI|nr:hypothetical protein LTR77_000177 [Saxophila tyrrhenica]
MRSSQADFPPTYEAEVNHNLRMFDQLEGQIGANNYRHQPANGSIPPMSRKKKVIVAVAALILLVALAGLTALLATSLRRHDNADETNSMIAGSAQTPRAETQVAAPAVTTIVITVTQEIPASTPSTASLPPTTLLTSTKPIPTPSTPTTSTKPSTTTSGSSITSTSSTSSTSTTSTSTTPTPSPPPPETLTPQSSPPSSSSTSEITTSTAGWMGFCSVPGMFCTTKRGVKILGAFIPSRRPPQPPRPHTPTRISDVPSYYGLSNSRSSRDLDMQALADIDAEPLHTPAKQAAKRRRQRIWARLALVLAVLSLIAIMTGVVVSQSGKSPKHGATGAANEYPPFSVPSTISRTLPHQTTATLSPARPEPYAEASSRTATSASGDSTTTATLFQTQLTTAGTSTTLITVIPTATIITVSLDSATPTASLWTSQTPLAYKTTRSRKHTHAPTLLRA